MEDKEATSQIFGSPQIFSEYDPVRVCFGVHQCY
jgi:hypothetical protein